MSSQPLSLEQSLQEQYRKLVHFAQTAVPEAGPFEPLDLTFRHPDLSADIGDMILTIGHFDHESNVAGTQRYLDFKAATPTGKSHSSQYLFLGNKADLQQFLTSPELLAKNLDAIRETIRSFQEHGAG